MSLLQQVMEEMVEELNEKSDWSDIIGSDKVDAAVEKLAELIYTEAKELAGEVWDEEGPFDDSKAETREEYVKEAAARFLNKEFQKAVMGNIVAEYKELTYADE